MMCEVPATSASSNQMRTCEGGFRSAALATGSERTGVQQVADHQPDEYLFQPHHSAPFPARALLHSHRELHVLVNRTV